jgi:hypothetical protein
LNPLKLDKQTEINLILKIIESFELIEDDDEKHER